MEIAAWLARASDDADARGLPELKPLLQTLARSTQALRDADAQFHHPAAEHGRGAGGTRAAEHARPADDDPASE